MHLCAAKCCENTTGSIDVVQGCVQKCSVPVTKAERYIHKELNEFQGRLQRCVMVSSLASFALLENRMTRDCGFSVAM